ncbi:MAG TPA: tetratricopeptide repeat protein [Sedimentisphaerales bacterium]|jgi:tetratricopeptide (TPR) repeat protein|nr:tetratricopeptide repeat protein [Sedimentisphaerales bacterium]HNU29684.1 tetratricopeptide repeat protein [Sedimentisphaerales bacterium]
MRRRLGWALAGVVIAAAVVGIVWTDRASLGAEEILVAYQKTPTPGVLTVTYPQDGTVFPPEIVPPTFRWEESQAQAGLWLVRVELGDGQPPVSHVTRERQWMPTVQEWERIKASSKDKDAKVLLVGVRPGKPVRVVSAATLAIRTSTDEVGAPLFYREVDLPFEDAVKDPSHIRWRFGSIASLQRPPVILENLPVCGNCHSFSQDGRTLAMDVDYANSKGSYVISPIKQQMVLTTSDIITWNDYRKEDGEQTFGLLSQMSPDGRYVISTVKDKSVFVPMPDLAFSQLFFPIKGILCVYDRQTKTFSPLPGADDPAYVQSNPCWSPDGRYVLFARSKAYDLKHTQGQGKILLTRAECKEFVEDGKPFLFDLYRVPFNEGRGGTPQPLEGASNNGLSNYFGRYSPDGKWIVFCRARSYMLLQKDSELYILASEGGQARRLACNTARMNSWHSFSPNGKWLVFSSKAWSDYTQLCLTHIDENGRSTPPVLLAHLTSSDRAANIPEFVNAPPDAIVKIQEQFLNDYSFVRAGNEFYRHGDADNAIAEYNNALQLNPDNVEAHQKLGFLLYNVKNAPQEGMAHLLKTLELDPRNPRAHYDLGMALLYQQKIEEATRHFAEALRQMPNGLDEQYTPARVHFHLGEALLLTGKARDAQPHLARVIELEPRNAQAHYTLAQALAESGQREQAQLRYSQAMQLNPNVDLSPALNHLLAAVCLEKRRFQEALRHEERALALAQAQGDAQSAALLQQAVDECRRLIGAANR